MKIEKWIKENTQDLSGKTVVITGSTGGLGNEICKVLAKLNAKLIFLNRNEEKSQKQKDELLSTYPNLDVQFIKTDMQDLDSIKSTCNKLKGLDVDILILNAGALNLARRKATTGYGNIFQINFISPYYIVKELIPQLQKKENSKVVVVGSIAHNYGQLRENDIDYSNEKSSQKIYGNAKRFLMFSLFELFKTVDKVKLSITHPGITSTNITSNYPKVFQPVIKIGMKIIYNTPKKACLSTIKGIFDSTEAYSWIGPKSHNIWGFPKKKKLATCTQDESKKIFEIAEDIYKNIDAKI